MIYKFRDLYPDKGPREKMMDEGPEVLTNVELLACIFITGNRKKSVIELAHEVIGEYNFTKILTFHDIGRVCAEYGLGVAKSAQLVALVELAKRLYKPNGVLMPTIRSAQDVVSIFKDLGEKKKEELRALYLNSRQKVIHEELISLGSENSNYVTAKEILHPAIELLARGFIIVHNHPSQVASPSEDDRKVTRKIQQACEIMGVEFFDHIILAGKDYYSFYDNKDILG